MKLDFNNFNRRGYAPGIIWESYAHLVCFHLDIKGGSLEHLDLAWNGLKKLGCHYADRIKITKHILKTKWQKAQDALTEGSSLEYSAPSVAHRRAESVSLKTKEGIFNVPYRRWIHGLRGNDLEEDTYFIIITIESRVLIPLLREHGVYNYKSFSSSEHLLLTIIDD